MRLMRQTRILYLSANNFREITARLARRILESGLSDRMVITDYVDEEIWGLSSGADMNPYN